MFGNDDSSTDRSEGHDNPPPSQHSPTRDRGLLHQVRYLFGEQEALRTEYLDSPSPGIRPVPSDSAIGGEELPLTVAVEQCPEDLLPSPRGSL